MAQIVPMILERIKENLEREYKDITDPKDAKYPHEIKLGMWQDDPKRKNVYITLLGGKRSDPNLQDGVSSLKDIDNVWYEPPVREVGGGVVWVRRLTASIGCYFIDEKLNEATAMKTAYDVLGIVSNIISNTQICDLSDDFGETGTQIFVAATNFYVSGGPPSNYIWRGEILVYAYTERIS